MKEEFLWYLWSKKLINQPIKTTEGEPLQIIESGKLNTDAGPDFFNAKIKIGSTIWVGNVEIHVKASDWHKHGHHYDRKYNNIILHLVYENDSHITNSNGKLIPTVEVRNQFDNNIYLRYSDFSKSQWWIPCANLIGQIEKSVQTSWLNEIIVHKIRYKADKIRKTLVLNNYDWNQTLYTILAIGFGFHVNATGFESLAKSLPYNTIMENRNDLVKLEALLFGQAGLLNGVRDDYPVMLLSKYQKMKKEYLLECIDSKLWNFLRLRPPNFPTIRIAQFAALLHQERDLHTRLVRIKEKKEIFDFFNLHCSDYWKSHYLFDKESKKRSIKLGKEAVISLAINIIVPLKYLHGRLHSQDDCMADPIGILKSLPPEKNKIVRKYQELGLEPTNAMESQALLFLKNNFCDHKKCLECKIGQYLINTTT